MCPTAISYFLFIGFYFVSASAEHDTLSGYIYYPEVNVYYKFVNDSNIWPIARLNCLRENATLVVPKTDAELDVVKRIFGDYITSMIVGADNPDSIHLGFQTFFSEEDYLTEKEINIAYFYINFADNEPNRNESKKILGMQRSGKYYGYSETTTVPYICQKEDYSHIDDIDNKHNSMKNFDPAYQTSTSGRRFKLHLTPKTWGNARSICYAEGGHLALIESAEDEHLLVSMMNDRQKLPIFKNRDCRFHLGFHNLFDNGQYLTVTGRNINTLKYINWAPDEPNGDVEHCGGTTLDGKLNNFLCDQAYPFFCELPPLQNEKDV